MNKEYKDKYLEAVADYEAMHYERDVYEHALKEIKEIISTNKEIGIFANVNYNGIREDVLRIINNALGGDVK